MSEQGNTRGLICPYCKVKVNNDGDYETIYRCPSCNLVGNEQDFS